MCTQESTLSKRDNFISSATFVLQNQCITWWLLIMQPDYNEYSCTCSKPSNGCCL